MTQTQKALTRAVEALDAERIGPDHFAFKERLFWYFISEADLELLGEGNPLNKDVALDYARQAPKWWMPEQRFAQKLTYPNGHVLYARMSDVVYGFAKCEKVTVDFDTGKEILVYLFS